MPTPPSDPYAAARTAIWRNRIAWWRGHPQEALFHAVAIAIAAALLLGALLGAFESISAVLRQLFEHYLVSTLATMVVAAAWAQQRARRRQRRQWADDWLAAQPLEPRLRQRLRWQAFGIHSLQQLAGLFAALWLAQPSAATAFIAAILLVTGGAAGHLLADLGWRAPAGRRARELPRVIGGRGSLWRWQLIESAAVLAPRRLAWMLLLILLVPRGPALMILPAIALVVLGALVQAWQRSLAVIPAAQQLLAVQPVTASVWLRRALAWPLLMLATTMGGLSLLAWLANSVALLWMMALVLPSLALLQLACTAAERHAPPRAALLFAVQLAMLVAVWQAMPPLGVPLWLLQMLWLWRRIRR